MTGTACDGLDLAYIVSDGDAKLTLGPSLTIPFADEYRSRLRERVTLRALKHFMDDDLAKTIANYHAHHIKEFMALNQLEVDAIGFHGQSVWHDPANGVTIQLGDCQHLANRLNIPIVGQMRQNDLANGGQGAPLAPIYHQALAAKLVKPVVFVNIGGLSNLSFIDQFSLIAGDVGTGNALLDDWMEKHTGIAQDTDGVCAQKGHVNQSILNKWLDDPFFSLPLPKSLDRMYFYQCLDDCQKLSVEDGAATLTSFAAQGILRHLRFLPEMSKQLVVCGGGCHNPVLMAELGQGFKNVLAVHDLGFNPDVIEAQLIAYLAARFFAKLPSSFPSTTGVREPTIAGQLFLPE